MTGEKNIGAELRRLGRRGVYSLASKKVEA